MKRILGIVAVSGLLTTAPAAFAGIDVFVDFGVPAPMYVAPLPVYVAPAPVVYRHREPRWHERREYLERREFRDHHRHHGHFRQHEHERY
jgi:hypothetical protein